MPGPLHNPIGSQSELEVPLFRSPVELSPQPERSLINTPRQTPNLSRVSSSSQGSLRQTADGSVMHPNLNSTGGEVGGYDAKKAGSHVMSWMSYDGDGSGPER